MALPSILSANADTVAILACMALTAATLVFVFLAEPDPVDFAPHRSRLDQLLERRDTIYDNLRDLKFEHRSGKFADEDYEEMKQALETEAAVVLTEIENVTGNEARLPRRDPDVRQASPSTASSSPRG